MAVLNGLIIQGTTTMSKNWNFCLTGKSNRDNIFHIAIYYHVTTLLNIFTRNKKTGLFCRWAIIS